MAMGLFIGLGVQYIFSQKSVLGEARSSSIEEAVVRKARHISYLGTRLILSHCLD